MSGELGAKRLGLIQELVPSAAQFAVLVNPDNSLSVAYVADLRAAAAAIGRQIEVLTATTSRDIDTAFRMLMEQRADALLVGPDPLFVSRRVQPAKVMGLDVPATLLARADEVIMRDAGEIESAVTAFAHSANGGLIVTPSALTPRYRDLIV